MREKRLGWLVGKLLDGWFGGGADVAGFSGVGDLAGAGGRHQRAFLFKMVVAAEVVLIT